MAVTVHQGNVFDVLPTLERGSADVVVTSPPYWRLRSYLPKDHPLKPLELGSEPTPDEYVANQVKVFRLVRDVMAEHAVAWLNVGDTYSAGMRTGEQPVNTFHRNKPRGDAGSMISSRVNGGVDGGNLCLIPQRLAIALQADGWIVRSVIVWHKPAPMPASLAGWMWKRCRVKVKAGQSPARNGRPELRQVGNGIELPKVASAFPASAQWSDCPGCRKCEPHGGYVLRRGSWRPTSSWEPVLMLAKSARYYADGIAVQQPAASATLNRNEYTRVLNDPDEQYAVAHDHETRTATANLRDVWTIAAEPLKESHYASFPTELVHRCLKAGTSARGYCPTCGAPWARVVDKPFVGDWSGRNRSSDGEIGQLGKKTRADGFGPDKSVETATLDWRPTCSCPPHAPRPARVLDPFAGPGRVGIEALRMGLDFVGVELNPAYCDMARRLLRTESPLFAGV